MRSIMTKTLAGAATFGLVLAMAVNAQTPTVSSNSSKGPAKAEVGKMAPGFTLTDANGDEHSLADFRGKYVVLEWINFDCPFVKKHYGSGNMPSLQEEAKGQDVVWLTICSSAPGKQGYFEGAALSDRMEKEGWSGSAYLIDADGTVGRMYEAKTTPHMYVIDPKGKLHYIGAIDSKPTANPKDIDGATNYVQAALTSVMNGREVDTPLTKSYGCSVKY